MERPSRARGAVCRHWRSPRYFGSRANSTSSSFALPVLFLEAKSSPLPQGYCYLLKSCLISHFLEHLLPPSLPLPFLLHMSPVSLALSPAPSLAITLLKIKRPGSLVCEILAVTRRALGSWLPPASVLGRPTPSPITRGPLGHFEGQPCGSVFHSARFC